MSPHHIYDAKLPSHVSAHYQNKCLARCALFRSESKSHLKHLKAGIFFFYYHLSFIFLNKHKILKLKRFQTFFKRNFGILFWLIMKTLRCMMWKLFDPYGHSVDLSIGRKRLYDCFCLHGLYSFSLISKLIIHNIKITLKNCFLKINVFVFVLKP